MTHEQHSAWPDLEGRSILVTGASGFLGARLVEVLSLHCRAQVKALVHTPSSQGVMRIARYPCEVLVADLRSTSLERIVLGCEVVVHCAYGTQGNNEQRFRTTVESTKNLLAAARKQRVQHFIHVSSVAVYGNSLERELADETMACNPGQNWYSRAKYEAEKVVQREAGDLRWTILRPTNIFGPYSGSWTTAPIQRIKSQYVALPGYGSGIANMVYVDNVILGILLSLNKPESANETYIINNDERLTWLTLYKAYANALGLGFNVANVSAGRKTNGLRLEILRSILRIARPVIPATSQTFRSENTVGSVLRLGLREAPIIRQRLGGRIGLYTATMLPISREDIQLYLSRTRFSAEKISRQLGYTQKVSFTKGISLSADWARYQGLA